MTRPAQKSIRFNAAMARALWEGRKTATWRMMKPQPRGREDLTCISIGSGEFVFGYRSGLAFAGHDLHTPDNFPGDRLLVKEPWRRRRPFGSGIEFRADADSDLGGWESDARMPICAARQAITILTAEPRRVLSITEAEARADGFEVTDRDNGGNVWTDSAQDKFLREIWEIYKLPRGVDPWGWRYTFTHERLTP